MPEDVCEPFDRLAPIDLQTSDRLQIAAQAGVRAETVRGVAVRRVHGVVPVVTTVIDRVSVRPVKPLQNDMTLSISFAAGSQEPKGRRSIGRTEARVHPREPRAECPLVLDHARARPVRL